MKTKTAKLESGLVVGAFVSAVYSWMAIGLAITGFVSWQLGTSQAIYAFIQNPVLFFGAIIAEFALVIWLGARIRTLSAFACTFMFVVYSCLNGVTLSIIFLEYTKASITSTFFVCASVFAVSSIYGRVTKRSLSSLGGFMLMGLLGILIVSVVNIFMQSSATYYVVGYIGIFIFIGLTAYDTQMIKQMAEKMPSDLDSDTIRKGAIVGALNLYLDFINLFLLFLRIFEGGGD